MKTLFILAAVGALGFGGYRLYEMRQAAQGPDAFVFLICNTAFVTQAEPSIKSVATISAKNSINSAAEAIQKSLQVAEPLGQWCRASLNADQVRAIGELTALSKSERGDAIDKGFNAARIRCPSKVGGVDPDALQIIMGSLSSVLYTNGG